MATNNAHYQTVDVINLDIELKETSGLHCSYTGGAYTINDSGNKSTIYQLGSDGNILKRLDVDIKNRDWEALTGDKNNFYVGDIGNNSGKRKYINIYTIPKNAINNAKPKASSRLSYLHNSTKKNEYLNHDFDAEAMLKNGDAFYLFSKSWKTGDVLVYKVPVDGKNHQITPITKLTSIPGLVTGADYDARNKRYILVGYELMGLGSFHPFVAILNDKFRLLKSFPVKGYGQVEGVCVTPNSEVWLTQEGSFLSGQKLIKLRVF